MPVLSHTRRDTIAEINSLSLPLQVLYICFDGIASHIPIPTVISLSRTHIFLINKLPNHLRRSFEGLLKSRMSAHRIDAFCTLLLETRAVISGSTALHFIFRDSHWSPGDFDLYAPFGTGYTVVRWLVVNEGYRIVSDGSRKFTFRPATIPVPAGPCNWLTDLGLDFLPPTPKRSPHSKSHYAFSGSDIYRVYKLVSTTNTFIDVIESSKPSFLPPITKFHSTLVMNYLTPKSLVVLYPTLTFRREAILQYRDMRLLESYDDDPPMRNSTLEIDRAAKQDYVEKYESRGFTFYSHPADLRRPCGAACPAKFREVGNQVDNWSVEVPFDTDQISSELSGMETLSLADPRNPPVDSEIPLENRRSDHNLRFEDPPTQESSQFSSPLHWSLSAPTPSHLPELNVVSQAGSSSESPFARSSKVPSRPSLPPTMWALNIAPGHIAPGHIAPRPNQRARKLRRTCTNPFCPLRGYFQLSRMLRLMREGDDGRHEVNGGRSIVRS